MTATRPADAGLHYTILTSVVLLPKRGAAASASGDDALPLT